MSGEPLSDLAMAMLKQAACEERGFALNGRDTKAAARDLSKRGLVLINPSVTRMKITPAGRFVLRDN
ncbi:MAG: hypothetical protein KBT70_00120 [Roseovarius sp.]|uniref:hypothetical protein n=1 Tax=Roseovarius sp. TaxID=1486281 RepID=UPI001B4007A0|nr:hypothetical protein [Roseovarius sp.]MBQ0748575.1 hypothetical protein [Roseovarius sp.]MBQ0808971.1 hypothetical protein [Roseovarius sp.]